MRGAQLPAYRVFKQFSVDLQHCLVHVKSISSQSNDTIYALSTAVGRAALAVFRLSGPQSDAALQKLLPRASALPPPRYASRATLQHPLTGISLDNALCLRFPAPRSFTGEDVVELHVHGGTAVVKAVTDALQATSLVRPAEPGEFTRRAFETGKMDLTQVEGLSDLLSAETEAQRALAIAAAGGATRHQIESWRLQLLTGLARVEAVIDFGEDEEIAEDIALGVVTDMKTLKTQLQAHIASSRADDGELIRQGIRVAILGPPNAGKSSLLNALAGRDVAIVSPAAGTTRDVLEVALDLGGYKVVVYDGAGIRESTSVDPVEKEGMARVLKTAQTSHIVIRLEEPPENNNKNHTDKTAANDYTQHVGNDNNRVVLHVLNKSDILDTTNKNKQLSNQKYDCVISCATGSGLESFTETLKQAVSKVLLNTTAEKREPAVILRARHKQHIKECIKALERYATQALALDTAAEELRAAARALGRVTGAIDTEDVLDGLFSEFCIGK